MRAPSVTPVFAPACCPTCASPRLHPQRYRAGADSRLTVELRCVECSRWTETSVTRGELAALDRRHSAEREVLRSAYERCVADSMAALADCLAIALERDLLGPEDFMPRRTSLT